MWAWSWVCRTVADNSEPATADSGAVKLVGRLLGVLARLAKKYAESAKVEATQDLQRILMGAACVFAGVLFIAHAAAFAHGAAVVGLMMLGIEIIYVLLGVLAFDLIVALVAIIMARTMILRPMLPQTRAQLQELQQAYEVFAG